MIFYLYKLVFISIYRTTGFSYCVCLRPIPGFMRAATKAIGSAALFALNGKQRFFEGKRMKSPFCGHCYNKSRQQTARMEPAGQTQERGDLMKRVIRGMALLLATALLAASLAGCRKSGGEQKADGGKTLVADTGGRRESPPVLSPFRLHRVQLSCH